MPGNIAGRRPDWMQQALELQNPDVPALIAPRGPVSPVLDAYQGGWGVGDGLSIYETVRLQIPAGTAQGDHTWVEGVPETGMLVLQCSSLRGGAGATSISVRARNTTLNLSHAFCIVDGTENRGWEFMAAGAPWWIVPPGFDLEINHSGTGAGDTLDLRALLLRFRAGFKPI